MLEIGCGEGGRLAYLKKNYNIECFGVEPSKKAVEKANSKGIEAKIGTADNLEFDDGSFDVVIFGFCLYLCDSEDLFKIAYEVDRVLKDEAILVIYDFLTPFPYKNHYKHYSGIYAYKMDYSKLFSWNQYYQIVYKKIFSHESSDFPTDANERIGLVVLKKNTDFAYSLEPYSK